MSILSGFKKRKRTVTDKNGNHTLVSEWTHADTVEFEGGYTLAESKRELTQAEYDALSEAEKMCGIEYIITDSDISASAINYDNNTSGLSATDMQGAIDELNSDKSHVGMVIHSTTLNTMEKVIALYGGTKWVKIEGKFLLGQSSSYAVNSTGGEASHTLTVDEIPKHSHVIGALYSNGVGGNTMPKPGVAGYSSSYWWEEATGFVTTEVGSSLAHNNMPPYKTVYIWERIA